MGGDKDAAEQRFTKLYQETRGDVLAYLVRRSRTVEDATDAMAETYAAAWRKLETLPEGERARLWLFGAARNELRMAERRAQASNQLAVELANQLRLTDGDPAQTDDSSRVIHEALSNLSLINYEIVTLTAWEGLAPREISAVLGLSANVVRIRLHRARSDLRGFLEDHESDLDIGAESVIGGTAT